MTRPACAVIDGYSEEFLSDFMELLRRSHPSTRVSAKVVYNEFIANKDHVHMNSTKWLTLTDFVKFLGREGYCKVDQTEKGWHLVYQKKDIEQELEEERKSKRHKAEKAWHSLLGPILNSLGLEQENLLYAKTLTKSKNPESLLRLKVLVV